MEEFKIGDLVRLRHPRFERMGPEMVVNDVYEIMAGEKTKIAVIWFNGSEMRRAILSQGVLEKVPQAPSTLDYPQWGGGGNE